jgi:Zn-dependent peptidase ImmA (M78 family)
MSDEAIDIDMMALADIGQPARLALEMHKQLREKFGTVPRRIPLEAIAKSIGIVSVRDVDVDAFEGTLVIKDGKGAIGLRKGLRSGRRNFTLGHEIGHFLIPTHRTRRERFECAKADMNRVRGGNWEKTPPQERIEVEANEFSATLLVPGPEYKEERRKLGKGSDVTHVRKLADIFDVSQEMLASIYVRMADEKIAIITSQNGRVARVIPAKGFPYLGLSSGVPVPSASLTHRYPKKAAVDSVSDLAEVRIDSWVERPGQVTALYEQVLVQKSGWATTLLMIDEDEADDEADDRNWNRRNARF